MPLNPDQVHVRVRQNRWLRLFTVFTRILRALAFLPSGDSDHHGPDAALEHLSALLGLCETKDTLLG